MQRRPERCRRCILIWLSRGIAACESSDVIMARSSGVMGHEATIYSLFGRWCCCHLFSSNDRTKIYQSESFSCLEIMFQMIDLVNHETIMSPSIISNPIFLFIKSVTGNHTRRKTQTPRNGRPSCPIPQKAQV